MKVEDERSGSRPPVAYAHMAFGLDAEEYSRRFDAGESPGDSPYGFGEARHHGWALRFSRDHPEGRLRRFVRRALRRVLGFDAIHLWRNRDRLAGADVVWTMQESEWLALRFLGWWDRRFRRPVVGNSVWLFNRWERYSRLHRWLYRRLARGGEGVLTVHSDRYLPLTARELPGARIERMYFGTSLDSYPIRAPELRPRAPGEPLRILAAGADATRDWDTFLAAFGNDDRFDVELICEAVTDERRSAYRNLRRRDVASTYRLDTFQQLYRWADVVVVPMVDNRFSGITVALEATANGKPLVSSRTGGVPTYFANGEALFADPGDPAALRAAALAPPDELLAVARAGQARFLRDDYSTRGMMARYIALSEEWLGSRS